METEDDYSSDFEYFNVHKITQLFNNQCTQIFFNQVNFQFKLMINLALSLNQIYIHLPKYRLLILHTNPRNLTAKFRKISRAQSVTLQSKALIRTLHLYTLRPIDF